MKILVFKIMIEKKNEIRRIKIEIVRCILVVNFVSFILKS